MDKIQKSLKKLNSKELRIVEKTVEKLISLNWFGLDVSKLKGTADIYRVRIGRLRIIFRHQKDQINLLAVERRSEKTYRNFLK